MNLQKKMQQKRQMDKGATAPQDQVEILPQQTQLPLDDFKNKFLMSDILANV
jgi:hypothetical protein